MEWKEALTIFKSKFVYREGKRKFRRHVNPDGTLGGYVEDTAKVSPESYFCVMSVAKDACVVHGDVRVTSSVIEGSCNIGAGSIITNSHISGESYLCQEVSVFDSIIQDKAFIGRSVSLKNCDIFGSAKIQSEKKIENAHIMVWNPIDYITITTEKGTFTLQTSNGLYRFVVNHETNSFFRIEKVIDAKDYWRIVKQITDYFV